MEIYFSPAVERRSGNSRNSAHARDGKGQLNSRSNFTLDFLATAGSNRRMSDASLDPPPVVLVERALDEMWETLNEVAKHNPPGRLVRELRRLIPEASFRITAMNPHNPALKEITLRAAAFLAPKFQTAKATAAHEQQTEARIAAIERLDLGIVKFRRIAAKDLARMLAGDQRNFNEKGRPLFGMDRKQVSDAKKELLKRIQKS
jgi:hypothetical protein